MADPSLTDAEVGIIPHNARFLSGSYGRDVVAEYTLLLANFESWNLPLGDAAEEQVSPFLAICLVDSWRRCFATYIKDTKFEVFAACQIAEGVPNFCAQQVRAVAARLRAKMEACEVCVDPDWTGVLLELMESQPARAYRIPVSVLIALRVQSSAVERAHLPAEETKPARARGRAKTAEELAVSTYLHHASADAMNLNTAVQRSIATKYKLSQQAFCKLQRLVAVGTGQKTSDLLKAAAKLDSGKGKAGKAVKRKTSRWAAFLSRNLRPAGRGHEELARARDRAHNLYRNLSAEEQRLYDGLAEAMDQAKAHALDFSDFSTYEELKARVAGQPHRLRQKAKKMLAMRMQAELKNHPAWECGAAAWAPGTALRPEYVLTDPTDEELKLRALHDLFSYDSRVEKNPPGTRCPRACCARKFFGGCISNAFHDSIQNVVHNVHSSLRTWKLNAESGEWPLIVTFAVRAAEDDNGCASEKACTSNPLLLTHDVGNGDTQLFLHLASLPGEEENVTIVCDDTGGHRIAKVEYAQEFFNTFFRLGAAALLDQWQPLEEHDHALLLTFVVHRWQTVPGRGRLVMKVGDVAYERRLPLQRRFEDPGQDPRRLRLGADAAADAGRPMWLQPHESEPVGKIEDGDGDVADGASSQGSLLREDADAMSVGDDELSDEIPAADEAVPVPPPPVYHVDHVEVAPALKRGKGIRGYQYVESKRKQALCVTCGVCIHVGHYRWSLQRAGDRYDRFSHIGRECAVEALRGVTAETLHYINNLIAGFGDAGRQQEQQCPPEIRLAAYELRAALSAQ